MVQRYTGLLRATSNIAISSYQVSCCSFMVCWCAGRVLHPLRSLSLCASRFPANHRIRNGWSHVLGLNQATKKPASSHLVLPTQFHYSRLCLPRQRCCYCCAGDRTQHAVGSNSAKGKEKRGFHRDNEAFFEGG